MPTQMRAWVPASRAGALALLLALTVSCGSPDEPAIRDAGTDADAASALGGRASRGAIGISDAVVVFPPGDGPAAAYMTIALAVGPDTLLHAELEDGRRAGVHGTETIDARVRMSDLGPMPLTEGESLRLHPGVAHIMIEEFDRVPSPGDQVPLVLHFARAGRVEVDARVVRYDQLDAIFPGVGAREAHAGH